MLLSLGRAEAGGAARWGLADPILQPLSAAAADMS